MGISRQRALPPEIFTSEEFATLPSPIRLTAIGLRMHADDAGRENANQRLLWSSIWPLSEEVNEDDLVDHLLILAELDYIALYSVGPRTYYQVTDWPKVDHGKPSRLPAPPSRTIRDGPRESFAAREGESEESESAESGASRDPSRTVPGLGPSPFCHEHPDGIDQPCRDCGTARLRHERWVAQQRADALAGMEPDDDR